MVRRYLFATLVAAVVAGVAAPSGADLVTAPAAGGVVTAPLARAVLPGITKLTPVGSPAPDSYRTVGLTLPGRDPVGLNARIAAEYDPTSPLFHHFLTPDEFAQAYGASVADASALIGWLQDGGLTITGLNRARTSILALGTVAQIEKLFATKLATFASGSHTFVANTVAPTVPVGVVSVTGLEDLNQATVSPADFPSAAPGGLGPEDLWSAYNMPANATNAGQGQRLTAFGWGDPGTTATDLKQFEALHNLPQIPLTIIQDGTPGTDKTAQAEWDLDSQASTGMANQVQGMTFYFVTSGSEPLIAHGVQLWADDPNGSKQASGSYGLCEAFAVTGEFDSHEKALQQAVAEGRSFFASTGDNGSGCSALVNTNGVTVGPLPSQEYPATSAFAIAVGGTFLYTKGSGATAQRDQEVAWSHGGGGPAYFSSAPSWQTPSTTAPYGKNNCIGDYTGNIYLSPPGGPCRGEADVAAEGGGVPLVAGTPAGDGGYNTIVGGSPQAVSGTSLSAPLWQGMWARINAAAPAVPAGSTIFPGLGYANPLIYGIGANSAKYAQDFFDVQVGGNGAYTALPGWDFPTGWGVPNVSHLMVDLAGGTAAANPVSPPAGGGGGGGTVLPACPAYPQIAGDKNDATQIAGFDTGLAALDAKALDITSAGVKWDAPSASLIFTIDVQNLWADPPSGSNGEYYRFDFTYHAVAYELFATRSTNQVAISTTRILNTGKAYGWTIQGAAASSISSLTGHFGRANDINQIQIILPASTFHRYEPSQPPLASGSVLSAFNVIAQRNDEFFTLTADSDAPAAPCAYTVPAT